MYHPISGAEEQAVEQWMDGKGGQNLWKIVSDLLIGSFSFKNHVLKHTAFLGTEMDLQKLI